MKKLLILMIFLPITFISAQKIGELAPEPAPEVFPDNAWGGDVMFSDGGFGLGTFLRKQYSEEFTGFADFSISESKDDREFDYYDYYGNVYTVGKKNRVFLLPINFGMQYRLFANTITDNLRPYINLGIGPTLVISTPYELDYFAAFGKANIHYAAGGYAGIGANIGISKTNLISINARYYFVRLFDEGVENITSRFRKDLSSFYITVSFGMFY